MWPIPELQNMVTVSSGIVNETWYLATKHQAQGLAKSSSHLYDLGQVTSHSGHEHLICQVGAAYPVCCKCVSSSKLAL